MNAKPETPSNEGRIAAGGATLVFMNRREAGRALAELLGEYRDNPDVVVLALPRGGVPIGFEIARSLHAPLDVFVVRKLGVPGYEEYAMGAIAAGGVRVMNPIVVALDLAPDQIDEIAARELRELERRERLYRGARAPLAVKDRIVIVVDDGLATGATMRAATRAVRRGSPRRVVVAVPVGAQPVCTDCRRDADDVVCVRTPEPFSSVGEWYAEFDQTTDDEVRRLLDAAWRTEMAGAR